MPRQAAVRAAGGGGGGGDGGGGARGAGPRGEEKAGGSHPRGSGRIVQGRGGRNDDARQGGAQDGAAGGGARRCVAPCAPARAGLGCTQNMSRTEASTAQELSRVRPRAVGSAARPDPARAGGVPRSGSSAAACHPAPAALPVHRSVEYRSVTRGAKMSGSGICRRRRVWGARAHCSGSLNPCIILAGCVPVYLGERARVMGGWGETRTEKGACVRERAWP